MFPRGGRGDEQTLLITTFFFVGLWEYGLDRGRGLGVMVPRIWRVMFVCEQYRLSFLSRLKCSS